MLLFTEEIQKTPDFEADSTQVGITMMGVDARYKQWSVSSCQRQHTLANLENPAEYNAKTSSDVGQNCWDITLKQVTNVLLESPIMS